LDCVGCLSVADDCGRGSSEDPSCAVWAKESSPCLDPSDGRYRDGDSGPDVCDSSRLAGPAGGDGAGSRRGGADAVEIDGGVAEDQRKAPAPRVTGAAEGIGQVIT